jgi:hypothetical protein
MFIGVDFVAGSGDSVRESWRSPSEEGSKFEGSWSCVCFVAKGHLVSFASCTVRKGDLMDVRDGLLFRCLCAMYVSYRTGITLIGGGIGWGSAVRMIMDDGVMT